MTKRKQKPLGPAWLADMVIALGSWRASLLVMWLSWMVRHWRGVGAVFLAGGVFVWSGSLIVAAVVLVVLYGLTRWRPAKRAARWWDHDTLSTALVDAGTLRMAGDKLPTLSYKGKPQHSEHGDMVIVGLPQAKGPEDIVPRRLAQALQIPIARLSVTQEPTDNANVARLHVGTPPKAGTTPPPVASMERTNWRDGLAIGRTTRGAVVTLQTRARNTISGGKPGMGKTSFGHMVMAHYLLDPTTRVLVLDGKGSKVDYAACAPLLDTYIGLQRPDVVDALIGMLRSVVEEVDRRNGADGEHDGMLLVLEEIQNVRSRAGDRKQLAEIDRLMGEIIRLGRAVNVHILTLTQKPSGDDIPTGFRSQFTQGLAFRMQKADYSMVLDGAQPEVALPTKEGEAIWCTEGDQERVVCYYLKDADWRQVCKRAANLRAAEPQSTGGATEERPPLQLVADTTELPAVRPLIEAVTDVLTDEPRGLPAAALHARLPGLVRESYPTPMSLGKALGRHRGALEQVHVGNVRVWKLVGAGRSGSSAGVS